MSQLNVKKRINLKFNSKNRGITWNKTNSFLNSFLIGNRKSIKLN